MDGYNQPQWEQSYNPEGCSYPPYYPPQHSPTYPPSNPPPYYPPPDYPPYSYPPPYYPPPQDYSSYQQIPYPTYEEYPPYNPPYQEPPYLPPLNSPPPLHEPQAQEDYNSGTIPLTTDEMLRILIQQADDQSKMLSSLEQFMQETQRENQENLRRHQEEQRRLEFLERTMEQLAQTMEDERLEEVEEEDEVEEVQEECLEEEVEEEKENLLEGMKDEKEEEERSRFWYLEEEEEDERLLFEYSEDEEGDDQEESQDELKSEISLSKPNISSIDNVIANDSVDLILPIARVDHRKEVKKVLGIVKGGRWRRRRNLPNLHKMQVWGCCFLNAVKAESPVPLSLILFEPQRLRYNGKRDYYPWPFR